MNDALLNEELTLIAQQDLPWERLMGKKIAVTGATGLIGAYLMRALDVLRRVHDLSCTLISMSRRPEAARALFEGMDVLCQSYDAEMPLGADFDADIVFHAAANAHPLAFSADPVGTMRASFLGTLNLLEAMHARDGRLLLLSSGEIYGDNPLITEGFSERDSGAIDTMSARACYPEGKRAAETLCAAHHSQFGTNALVARLTYVYGPTITDSNSRADAQFLRRALAGEDIVLKSAGTQVRSYTYVADAAAALLTLLLVGEAGQAYNVANPASAVSIRDYAAALAELAGVQLRFELPPENERRGYSTVSRAVLRNDKLCALGWSPRYDLRTGLAHTLAIKRGS